MANPTLIDIPIAENGERNAIPQSVGSTSGLLDQEHGFQAINSMPLSAGGIAPERKDFNGAFNLLSKILFYTQKGWRFEFDENQDYYAGCIVMDTDGHLYEALADVSASSTHPKDDTTNWHMADKLPVDGGGALTGASLSWNGDDLGGSAIVSKSFGQASSYIKNKSGLIYQFGYQSISTAGLYTINFPISFTGEATYKLIAIGKASEGSTNNITVTQQTGSANTASSTQVRTSASGHSIRWMAIGY